MSKPQLTKEIAYTALQAFFNQKPFVLFASGASCAVDLGFGMLSLELHLRNKFPSSSLTKPQADEWNSVLDALAQNKGFEEAMDNVNDISLLTQVINETAKLITGVNQKQTFALMQSTKTWPAIGLFQRMVSRLPETDRILHVATPNYDLLAEYAFTQAGIPYSTGFWGGIVRQLDWQQAERQMTYAEKVSIRAKVNVITRIKKHIRLYKVHGSLNTFQYNHRVIETDAWNVVPDGVERLMITPGTAKHQKLHNFRDALLKEYDKAIANHNAFLFLGFGFNDTQLVNNAICSKLKNQNSPALIITRDANDRIDKLLQQSKNTWLVCKHEHNDNDSTRIFNCQYKDWLSLPDQELWQFDQFATAIMGG